jgi:tRNA modification GTPase
MHSGDTIVAISSAVGAAGRMIVRMSGDDAFEIAGAIAETLPPPGEARLCRLEFAALNTPGWVYRFAHPRSYSGEDSVEFHIAGNPLLARLLLDTLIGAGARPAEPGEFTARAYFNGRLDLSEAEGVGAIIAAGNQQELRAARQLLAGELSRRLRPVMDSLAQTLALVEVGIDFSEEDVSFLDGEALVRRVGDLDSSLRELVEQSARFEQLAHEPAAVLVGRPNAGKSTLLNALAGQDRAIVSPIAGTTRDALSAELRLAHGLIRLIDAAGLEESAGEDSIARQMAAQSLQAIEAADLVLLARDVTDPSPAPKLPRPPDLIIYTKIDLADPPDGGGIAVSAAKGINLDSLRDRLDALAFGSGGSSPALALNARHMGAIAAARSALARAGALAQARAAEAHAGAEVIALELREALDALGQVLGQVSPDQMLGRVFSSFCIGK